MPTPSPETARRADVPVPPALARRKRPVLLIVSGCSLAVAAGFAVRGMWPGTAPAGAATRDVLVTTAAVVRTDVSARQVVAGTLGYQGAYSVVNESGPGIVTWLPAVGRLLRRNQALFQLAGQPVTLLYGAVPAWPAAARACQRYIPSGGRDAHAVS